MEFRIDLFCCLYPNCGKEYLSKQNLNRHINISHLLKKQSKCSLCSKTFINSINLKEHYLIHTKSKPYRCNICNLRFRHKAKLGSHRRTHNQEV